MDTFAAARAAARHSRAQALRERGGEAGTLALIQAALRLAGLTACPVDDDDSCLCGAEAVLDRATGAIFYKASAAQALALFEIAHELGHFWMEGESSLCDSSGLDLTDAARPRNRGLSPQRDRRPGMDYTASWGRRSRTA